MDARLKRLGFRALVVGALALAGFAQAPGSAQAQSRNPMQKDWVGPPAKLPRVQHGDRTHNLSFLFDALKAAPDATSAKAVEDRIWAFWLASDSDTTTLLMSRVKTATDSDDVDLAIKLLDVVVQIDPDYTEAWNRRATLFYMKKEYGRALADIGEVLKREPRHFGALAGLGLIMQDLGDDKNALVAYRRALAVDPYLSGIADKVKSLAEKVEGRDI